LKKTDALYQSIGLFLVEARGIEPLSEIKFTEPSPGAVDILNSRILPPIDRLQKR